MKYTNDIVSVARRFTGLLIVGCFVGCLACANLDAAEHDFVGTLQLAVDDDGAKLLSLSDDVHSKLTELVHRRTQEGQRLLGEASLKPDEERAWLENWVQASERLGNALLTLKQREQLTQLLLARDGLVTLSRPDVNKILALTRAQKEKIDELLRQRGEAIEGASRLKKQIAVGSYERKLQAVLSASQLTQWEVMAGNRPGPNVVAEAAVATNDPPRQQDNDLAVPKSAVESVRIRFAFEKTPWREVIDGLATKAKLSVFVASMPSGGLTYADGKEYTLDEAIQLINRFLVSSGYALIRSGKMLSVIGLQDSGRDQLLDSLADYVSLSELDRRGDNEVVKCIFTMAKADPKEALAEIQGLVKLSTPLLLPKSKQLLVIERAAKLRIVRDTLEAMESPGEETGPVRRFDIEHARPKDVLAAIRPLVGIADDATNVGEGISFSIDADGKQILATGSAEKLAIVEAAVKMLDKPLSKDDDAKIPVLRTHLVQNGNLQAIDDVLQTLLADEDVRLAQEPKTSRIILLATEEIHARVVKTIAEFEGEADVFEVIQLKSVEPYVAMSVLREMLDIPFFADDEEEGEPDYPRLDWDTPSMRLFVRGRQSQVDMVKKIVDSLEKPLVAEKDSRLRLLPIQGERAEKLLETGGRFWPGNDDILIFPPSTETNSDVIEREINGTNDTPLLPPKRDAPTTQRNSRGQSPLAPPSRMTLVNAMSGTQPNLNLKTKNKAVGPQVKAQVTPRGILLQSDDVELLNKFEDHLRTIAGPGELSDSRLAIFYLKHVRVSEAKSLLSDIRRGSSSSSRDDEYDRPGMSGDSQGPSRPRRSYFSFSEPSIIADARLNRLIVQGKATEILEIEKHLQIIDRDKSIADIQFRGKPRTIQLVHLRAVDAAKIVREAYAGQLGAAPAAQPQPAQQKQQQAQAQQAIQAQLQQAGKQQEQAPPARTARSSAQGGQQKQGRNEQPHDEQAAQPPAAAPKPKVQQSSTFEPTMTLAVDTTSNALIVRAPNPLFEEVSELVHLIDENAAQATAIVPLKSMNVSQLQSVLRGVTGKQQKQASQPTSTPAPQALPQQIIVQPSR